MQMESPSISQTTPSSAAPPQAALELAATELSRVATSRAVLAHHARSFRFAALFLPRQVHDDAAMLYAFCRYVDDAVDEAKSESEARNTLDSIDRVLRAEHLRAEHGQESGRDAVALDARHVDEQIEAVVNVMDRREMDRKAAIDLVAGVRGDLEEVRVADDAALLRYCYLAAGTVGLMMCGVLGVRDERARRHAIDLGIGMQLTNICRDVREDAEMGRVYLPASRLSAEGVSATDVVSGRADRRAVARVVSALLEEADRRYASGDAGMRYIPWRPRLAIYVASRLYRAIGVRLRSAHACDAFIGRTVVPFGMKIAWMFAAIFAWVISLHGLPHQDSL